MRLQLQDYRTVGATLLVAGLMVAVGCGGSSTSGGSSSSTAPSQNPAPTPAPSPAPAPDPAPSPSPAPAIPQFGHVFLVMEENHGYSDVIGNSGLPYINQLASQYGLATQYYSNTHPSIGNYFMLTTGQIITNDDAYTGVVTADNIVRELSAAGKTWKSYAESLPSAGYLGGDSYPYAKRHNPFAYLSDVVNSQSESQNVVPFADFSADLANGNIPEFSYIVPNLLDDAHDGTLPAADLWLQKNIAPLISSSLFQKDGLLIVVFDEAEDSDTTHGGGQVAALIISPKAKAGFSSTTLYQHQSTLRLIMEGLSVTKYPGAAASAPEMSEFF